MKEVAGGDLYQDSEGRAIRGGEVGRWAVKGTAECRNVRMSREHLEWEQHGAKPLLQSSKTLFWVRA